MGDDFFGEFTRRLADIARHLDRAVRPDLDLDRRAAGRRGRADPSGRAAAYRARWDGSGRRPKRRRDPGAEPGGLPVRPDRPSGLSGGAAAALDFDEA
jgi:hypothetical protein